MSRKVSSDRLLGKVDDHPAGKGSSPQRTHRLVPGRSRRAKPLAGTPLPKSH